MTATGAFQAVVNVSTRQANGVQARSDGVYVQVPQTGSTFPAAPNDGDVQIVSPAVGVKWQFQWSAAAGVTDKWLFIGGAPLYGYRDTSATISNPVSGSWYDFSTVDQAQPNLNLPYPGVYQVNWGARITTDGIAGDNVSVGVSIANDTPTSSRQTGVNMGSGTVLKVAVYKTFQITAATGQNLTLKFQNNGAGGITASDRLLHVIPVRVSAP